MTETPTGRRRSRRVRRARERLGRRLSETPRWAKQVSTFIVTAAAVVGAVATIIALVKPPQPPVLGVELGEPEWAAHDLTLGSYLAWQQRESDTLGLRPGGESAAAALDGGATHSDAKQIVLKLARYTSLMSGASAQSGTSGSTAGFQARATAGTTTAGESEADAPDTSRLKQKASEQEAIIKEAGAGSGPALTRTCQGVGYGGCSPEAAEESATPPSTGATSPSTGATSPSTGGSGPPTSAPPGQKEAEATTTEEGAPRPPSIGRRQRELLEIAEGARLGRATNASLIPPLMTAGLSGSQRARVASVLGDAVSFNVHTRGWIGQQLWLTWTMYEKHDRYWNPSSREYLIDHAEAYVVPTAADDEGILTFWFPIPKQRGDYQVRYFIRAPGSGKKVAGGKCESFRS